MIPEARKLHYVRYTPDKRNVFDTKTECAACREEVGLLDNYCKNCGVKFTEVEQVDAFPSVRPR